MIPFRQKHISITSSPASVCVLGVGVKRLNLTLFTGLTETQDCHTEQHICETEGRLIWNMTVSITSGNLRV